MSDVEFRRATPADAPAMAVAHLDSIRSIGPAFYASELVDAWAAVVTPEMYVKAMAEGEVFFIAVAASGGDVLGSKTSSPAKCSFGTAWPSPAS
jgi:hypothetical protein